MFHTNPSVFRSHKPTRTLIKCQSFKLVSSEEEPARTLTLKTLTANSDHVNTHLLGKYSSIVHLYENKDVYGVHEGVNVDRDIKQFVR